MKSVVGFVLLASSCNAYAHQPVMDMAPRWADGYGFQLRAEHYGSDDLKRGSSDVANPGGAEREVSTVWLEAVYTFNRSIRATIKMPYVDQTRTIPTGDAGIRQDNTGIGDVIIGLPLKKYKNRGSVTQNWGITPSLRIPTGDDSGSFPISDGSWDVGLSLSYAWENPLIYQLYDLYYWNQGSGSRDMQTGDSWGLDVNVGLHPWHDNATDAGVFLLWDVSAHHEEPPNLRNLTTASGGDRVHTGPVFIFYRDNFMVRGEYKFVAYEHVDGVGLSRGDEYSLAVGITF
jgi:hypothetical protein